MLDASGKCQTLLEELLRVAIIALSHRNLAEVGQPDRLPDLIAELAKDADGFLFASTCLGDVVLLQIKRGQSGQSTRRLGRLPQAAADLQALLQHRRGLGMIALVRCQHTAHVERMCARDGRLLQ